VARRQRRLTAASGLYTGYGIYNPGYGNYIFAGGYIPVLSDVLPEGTVETGYVLALAAPFLGALAVRDLRGAFHGHDLLAKAFVVLGVLGARAMVLCH